MVCLSRSFTLIYVLLKMNRKAINIIKEIKLIKSTLLFIDSNLSIKR